MARIGKADIKDISLSTSQQNKILARARSISKKVFVMVQLEMCSIPVKLVKNQACSLGGRIIG